MWLLRMAGSGSNRPVIRAKVPAIVRALTSEQLVGAITQQNLFLIISPTHLFDGKRWPGGITQTLQSNVIDISDPRFPNTSDNVVCRGSQKQITNAKPVFDSGECIRIELSCLG